MVELSYLEYAAVCVACVLFGVVCGMYSVKWLVRWWWHKYGGLPWSP
jgi:hypothetical protein